MGLSLGSTITTTSELAHRKLAEEVVILNLASGRYYGLAEVAARIWELIQTPCSIQQVCDTLVTEYEVDPAECERDLLALLEQLLQEQLIGLVDVPST